MKKLLLALLVLIGALYWYLPRIDAPMREGEIKLAALAAPVTVLRGDDGIPYLYADSLADALTAQGFLHAQDRLFQLELHRHLAHGKLAEFIGEKGLRNDRIVRLVDIPGFARRYLKQVSDQERAYLVTMGGLAYPLFRDEPERQTGINVVKTLGAVQRFLRPDR